ncbi:PAS domain-containing protein [Rhizobium cauense]|uniref:HWE histidine kinase domain-containing protein n=1 Tax=Rhizobium cauense TaxID=1166683 RepID=UPI001C6E60C2|nr:HWE histidine kinase domain-containing protein [Rhizobium cauense]MBW9114850.1 PAS domain-containing protein [Rhizobium cauense]
MPSPTFEPDRRFIEAALAESDDCIKIIGLDGTLQYMSEGGQRVMEVDDFEAVRGCPWPDFWQGQGNLDAVAAIEAARSGRRAHFTGYADTAKGNPRVWDVKVSPIFRADGTVESILSVSRDVTDLKAFEKEQSLLRHELSHRIKNILAIVQSVANQTLKNDDDMRVAKPALLARLAALGRAHDILMQSAHDTTTMQAVVETASREQPTGRIIAEGPAIQLSAKSGLALALALHELSTNALKYGALSNDSGKVSISWQVVHDDEDEQLEFIWVESHGPPVARPDRKGFGSQMIERALSAYVRGRAELDYRPDGLIFRLTAPVIAFKQG